MLLLGDRPRIDAAKNSPLALSEQTGDTGFHSKISSLGHGWGNVLTAIRGKRPEIFDFFAQVTKNRPRIKLV
jgi:hypothetical protein